MSHAAFLNAIRFAPEDDTARLVYADFLDEEGGPADTALAEFIRVQIELSHLSDTDPRRPALEDRENELLRAHETAWLGPLPFSVTTWKFERGFLAEVGGTATALTHADTTAALAGHAVTRVSITSDVHANDPCAGVVGAQWLSQIRELELDNVNLSAPDVLALLVAPALADLKTLKLRRTSGNGDLGALLPKCPWFATLKRFESFNGGNQPGSANLVPILERSGVTELRINDPAIDLGEVLTGKLADRLTRLEAEGLTANRCEVLRLPSAKPALTHLGIRYLPQQPPKGLAELLNAPACANVTALDLNEAHVRAAAVDALGRSAFWKRCREFRIVRGKCPPRTMKALIERDRPPDLRVLKLGETGLRDLGVAHLCEAPWADSLVELDIMRNYLTDAACAAIRDSGRLANVRHLDIRTNGPKLDRAATERITDTGLEALAAAPGLARLRHLNCHSLPIDAGALALFDSPQFRLAELDIGGTDVTANTIRELAKRPNLARLTRISFSFIDGLGKDDLIPLAESEFLSPLCFVNATYHRFSARCRGAMGARLGRRHRGS